MKFVEKSLVLSNIPISKNCYKLILESPKIAESAKPGQFVEVGCGEKNFPLLKRPISIHNAYETIIEIIYYVVGQGTALLSKKQPGEELEVVGSLGNGFKIENTEKHILVGGGYGVPPMYFLAKELLKTNKPENIFVCIGARCEKLILCRNDFMELGINLCLTTDDGSCGRKGFVTDAAKAILDNNNNSFSVYACGPTVMMKNLYKLTSVYERVKGTQCSMEHVMACGVGVCNGCVLEIKNGDSWTYKRVCKDGPVFEGAEIIW